MGRPGTPQASRLEWGAVMGLTMLTLAMALVGLGTVAESRTSGSHRHCDYTRPGVEPWWRERAGDGGDPQPSSRSVGDQRRYAD